MLDKRFSRDFFSGIPSSPGVYRFLNEDGVLLYIGKAKDLKKRIASYRRAHDDRVSRKVTRLLRMIEKIEWSLCKTEEEALLLENRLLRELKPPFNVLNVNPENYYFVGLKTSGTALELRLTCQDESAEPSLQIFGCFKGRATTRDGFAAILRRLWFFSCENLRALNPLADLPLSLMRDKPLYRHTLFFENSERLKKALSGLRAYLKGTSISRFLTDSIFASLDDSHHSGFIRHILEKDREALLEFFERGPKRNRKLLKAFAPARLRNPYIEQFEIDDWIVRLHSAEGSPTFMDAGRPKNLDPGPASREFLNA